MRVIDVLRSYMYLQTDRVGLDLLPLQIGHVYGCPLLKRRLNLEAGLAYASHIIVRLVPSRKE